MAFCMQVVPSSGDAQEKLAKIQRTHLGYLQLDENNEKLRTRKILEDLIASHLSTVPHKEKFPCPKFLDILGRSIEEKADFNACKASRAFDALEKYAVNLLCQPWRQEYHYIRLYSGFYQHHIDRHLKNAQEVLYLMGYEPFSKMEVYLSEPIDPDKVIDVSLNCLIAAVECQIMMQIMEKVGGEYMWRNVGYVRRHNICDIVKAVHILMKADKRGRTYISSHEKGKLIADTRNRPLHKNNGYVKVEKLVDVPCTWSDSLDMMEADQRYPTNAYGSHWEKKSTTNGHNLENVIFKPQTLDEHITASYNLLNDPSRASHSQSNSQTRDDCWGFVVHSLERKGYNKDHGERGDLLKGLTSCEVNPVYVDKSCGINKNRPVAELSKYNILLDEAKHPARAAISLGFGGYKKPSISNNMYAAPLPHASAQNEGWDYYPSTCPFPGYRQHSSAIQNMISFDSSLYNDGVNYSNCYPPPKILPEHVCRRSVPYMPTPLARSAVDPVFLNTMPTQAIRAQPQNPKEELQSFNDVLDARGTVKDSGNKRSRENRRSWYDNISNDDGSSVIERPPASIDMPSADKVMAHLGDQIVLPPPTPFQSEPSPSTIPTETLDTVASLVPSHRRQVSDGGSRVIPADSANTLSKEKLNNIPYLDKAVSSTKSSLSSGAERRATPVRDETNNSKDISRRESSGGRHERSPSAGSVQRSVSSGWWNCWACTYLNRPEREICEMCSRSRLRGAESSPLSSGGHECQQCTLVNVKGAVKCEACGLSLENSPTYV